jgi:hypothetical protein
MRRKNGQCPGTFKTGEKMSCPSPKCSVFHCSAHFIFSSFSVSLPLNFQGLTSTEGGGECSVFCCTGFIPWEKSPPPTSTYKAFALLRHPVKSRDSSVGIATSYGLDDRGVGVRVPVGTRIFFFPRRPGRLWGPPSFLYNGYRGPFPRG